MKSVLLVCPSFMGYQNSIKLALESKGFYVYLIDERAINSMFFKLLLRLNFNFFLKFITYSYFKKEIKKIPKDIDSVFCVNIESIEFRIMMLLKKRFKNSKFSLYMWDSLVNKPLYKRVIGLFDKVSTFDPIDANALNIQYEPLFYTPKTSKENNEKIFDFSFIGTAHADRPSIIECLISDPKYRDLSAFIYLYYPNKFLFFIRFLFDRNISYRLFKMVKYKPLDYSSYQKVLEQSRFVIDINHPRQNGMTMRFFESLNSGCVVVSTIKNIPKDIDLSQVRFLDRESIDFSFLLDDSTDFSHSSTNLTHYNISNWLERVLV